MSIKKYIKLFIPPILLPSTIKILLKKKEDDVFKYENVSLNRLSLINAAINKYNNCQYLEIGVSFGYVFDSVPLPITHKHGVDPERGGQYRMTSDEFFEKNNILFDVIFLDGLHTYTQLKKDFNNSIKCLKENGIIFIHDLIPRNSQEEGLIQPKNHQVWKGDVWKLGVELNFSKNIDFRIANIDQGVGIVKIKKGFEYKKIENIEKKNFEDFKIFYKDLNIISAIDSLNFINSK